MSGATLFIAATPLHAFFSLGLMEGPYREGTRTLALVDQRPQARDYIAEALQASGSPGLSVVRFPILGSLKSARRVLTQITAFTAELAPSTIAVGNDRRVEFYAAIRGCPSARRTYIDDGLYSYLPRQNAKPAWRERFSNWRRTLKYGVALERPSVIGGSCAVQDAYVLLPQRVHAGLVGKPVHAFRPEWFARPWVRQICAGAATAAGLDAARCRGIDLLLLLPHPRFLEAYPQLRRRMETLVAAHVERGEVVALKGHPAAAGKLLQQQLNTPSTGVIEVPARLPVEVLVPLLSGTLVVGSLTTALLSLVLLGDRVSVRSLLPPSAQGAGQRYNEQAARIYESVGIRPFDEAEAN